MMIGGYVEEFPLLVGADGAVSSSYVCFTRVASEDMLRRGSLCVRRWEPDSSCVLLDSRDFGGS